MYGQDPKMEIDYFLFVMTIKNHSILDDYFGKK